VMSADDGVIPVGDVDGAVGADGDIARPEPFGFVAGGGIGRDQLPLLETETRAVPNWSMDADTVPPRVGVEDAADVFFRQQSALVHDDPSRSAGAGDVAARQDAGIVLMPVRR